MIGFETEDVLAVLKLISPYLIALGVILVVLLISVFVVKPIVKSKKVRHLVRGEIGMLALLVTTIFINLIAFGPMKNLLDLTNKTSDGLSTATINGAKNLCEDISDEGFVLLKNEQSYLPLNSDNKKLALYGYRSAHNIYGGSGSGGINDLYEISSLKDGLTSSGFEIDEDLYSFFYNYSKSPTVTISNQAWDLPEPKVDDNYKSLIKNSKKNGYDTAVIVLGRMAGEGHNDMPLNPYSCSTFNNHFNSDEYNEFEDGEHYLQLTTSEKNMVKLVCDNYSDVIVIYNGANPLELGFVNDYSQIKSVLWTPGPGNVGFHSVGKIISGTVNPSGRTTDSFYYDIKKNPSYNNFTLTNYSNLSDLVVDGMNAGKAQKYYPSFVNYTEGIYVGYKYYETASDLGLIDFNKTIQYPFGYGLSYTSFTQNIQNFKVTNEKVSFDVTVKNTGKVKGKDTIEVYFNPPYIEGGIEKASKNLISFEKTKELEPNESQIINISFSLEDIASYDYQDKKCYVLDKGEYEISIQKNSHEIIEYKKFTLDDQKDFDSTKRESDKSLATNKLDDVKGDITYLYRKNKFENLNEATKGPASDVMDEETLKGYHLNSNYDHNAYIDDNDVMPTTGAKNNILLKELRGKDYNDPLWDKLLDELTVDEMDNLVSMGGYQTVAIDSIGKVKTGDFDGPASINNNFTNQGSIGFPIEVVLACTFNQELIYKYGKCMGQMNKELGGHGWYAPACNLHRSPFTGRNYEYFSEDSFLSGIMSAQAILGAKEVGIYSYVKHFAMYDFNGKMTCVWANEQAIREIYLKPFEIAVKKGKAGAVMISWSFIRNKWVGEKSQLINGILRDEWGFEGMVITDFFRNNGHGFMNADIALANGVDLMLSTYSGPQNHVTDKTKASNVKYMRNACHNILYTVVNSCAYENEDYQKSFSLWRTIAISSDVIVGIVVISVSTLLVIQFKRRKEEVNL